MVYKFAAHLVTLLEHASSILRMGSLVLGVGWRSVTSWFRISGSHVAGIDLPCTGTDNPTLEP